MFILFCVLTVAVIAAGVCLLLFNREKKPLITVEFYPPEGITPLQFSSYLYGEPRLKDVPVIILQWAREGFVKIKKDGNRNFIVKKIKSLPDGRPLSEVDYFNTLFREGGVFSSAEMKSRLGQMRDNELNSAAKGMLKDARVNIPLAKGVKECKIFFCISYFVSVYLPVTYEACIVESTPFTYVLIIAFIAGIMEIACIGFEKWLKNGEGPNTSKRIIWFVITLVLRGFMLVPVAVSCFNGATECGVLCLIAAIWYFAGAYILKNLFKKRTKEAQDFYGKVLGFKQFIKTAEASRIEALNKENPNYINEILPYCLVAEASDKVDKSFTFIGSAAPEWSAGFDLKDIASAFYYSFIYRGK